MKILGIDPASICGFAHSDGARGVWILKDRSKEHPGLKLERFRRQLFIVKRELGVDVIGVEEASFGSHAPKIKALHSELIGVAKLVASEWQIPIFEWTPSHLKKWLTGNGRAEKPQMIAAVNVQFGLSVKDDNIADAVAVMERTKVEVLNINGAVS